MTRKAKDNPGAAKLASTQAMLEAYRASVEQVAGQMSRAVDVLESLYAEQDDMIERLQAILARNRSLRRADFNAMFARVLADRGRAREVLSGLVERYRANRQAVGEALSSALAGSAAEVAGAWPGLKERLLSEDNDEARQVASALRRVHVEQEELTTALWGLLHRGDRLKIRDVRVVAKSLADRDSRQTAELSALLDKCEAAGRDVGLAWLKLAS